MQAGDIVTIKVSGELVYILDIVGESHGLVTVRRAMIGEDGVTYIKETFYIEELETLEEHLRRSITEMKLKSKLQKELFAEEVVESIKTPDITVN